MPNHITNQLQIHAFDAELRKILETIKSDEDGIGSIDFNKIIPMPPSLQMECSSRSKRALKIYQDFLSESAVLSAGFIARSLPKEQSDLAVSALWKKIQTLTQDAPELLGLGRRCYENLINHGHTDWYSWSIEKRGTKWNAYGLDEPDAFNEDEGTIQFLTAWSAPHPVIKKLSEMFPEILFYHRWADEDFGYNVNECEYQCGEIISKNIPVGGCKEAFEMAADIMRLEMNSEDTGYYLSEDETIQTISGVSLNFLFCSFGGIGFVCYPVYHAQTFRIDKLTG